MTKIAPLRKVEVDSININPRQARGLLAAFNKIRQGNPSINGAADYWLMKNTEPLSKLWETICHDRNSIYEKYVVTKTINDQRYFVSTGKDNQDVVYSNLFGFFREIEGKEDLLFIDPLDYRQTGGIPTWDMVVPAEYKDEDIQAVMNGEEIIEPARVERVCIRQEEIIKTPYKLFYHEPIEESQKNCMEEISSFEDATNYSISLWKLDFEEFKKLTMQWPNPNSARESMEEFRKLIYDNALKN